MTHYSNTNNPIDFPETDMNERSRELIGHIDVNAKIRELAEQSGCKIDRLGYGEGNLEKFAELIVRECCEVINKDCNLQ